MNLHTSLRLDSPVGPLLLAATRQGLSHLLFEARSPTAPQGDGSEQATLHLEQAQRELQAYFRGELRRFGVALAPSGTEFQRAAWGALREIPFGETRTYRQLAEAIARPKAVRAVGAANGRNPISIIVPCHRVIGADGSLTGFGGGIENKKRLLQHEGAWPQDTSGPAQLALSI